MPFVSAGSIRLELGGISSEAASDDGGNITLSVHEILLLRRGSLISTTAGTASAAGDGGNITINTPFIVAAPPSNSDITANAFNGTGGRITINATGIFGIAPRSRQDLVSRLGTNDLTKLDPRLLATSDITAISQTNPDLSGTVTINTPDVDPSRGLVSLPAVPIDTEVVQACTPGGSQQQSEFIITGRGGLPPNPGKALSTDAVMVDLITLNPEVAQPSTPAVSPRPTSSTPVRIVEAQGWVIDANGNVVLTANAPTAIRKKSRISRIKRLLSVLLLLGMFLGAGLLPPAFACMCATNSIVQNLLDAQNLLAQGRKFYEASRFNDAAAIWQQAVTALKASEDEIETSPIGSNGIWDVCLGLG